MSTHPASSGDVKELKIKLSKKDKELEEAVEKIQNLEKENDKLNSVQIELTNERDQLRLRDELMEQMLREAGVEMPDNTDTTVLDDYKAEIEKLKSQLKAKDSQI